MDMQTPDHASTPFPTSSSGPPSRMFSRRLLKILAATTPRDDDDPTALAETPGNHAGTVQLAQPARSGRRHARRHRCRRRSVGHGQFCPCRPPRHVRRNGDAPAQQRTCRRPRLRNGAPLFPQAADRRRAVREVCRDKGTAGLRARSRRPRNRSSSLRKSRPGSSRCDRAPNRSPPCSGRAIASARRSPTGAET